MIYRLMKLVSRLIVREDAWTAASAAASLLILITGLFWPKALPVVVGLLLGVLSITLALALAAAVVTLAEWLRALPQRWVLRRRAH